MQEVRDLQVVLMGMGTVFVCLAILIVMIVIMGKIMQGVIKPEAAEGQVQPPVNNVNPAEKQKIVAAISVAIAEELKTDVSMIRIHSITPLPK
ncbi:MAG: OadG family protein [Lachnospiraceae bacterium]